MASPEAKPWDCGSKQHRPADGWADPRVAPGSLSIPENLPSSAEVSLRGMADLGYPAYFVTTLGIWKVLGLALLAPRLSLDKEWAHAGIAPNRRVVPFQAIPRRRAQDVR